MLNHFFVQLIIPSISRKSTNKQESTIIPHLINYQVKKYLTKTYKIFSSRHIFTTISIKTIASLEWSKSTLPIIDSHTE